MPDRGVANNLEAGREWGGARCPISWLLIKRLDQRLPCYRTVGGVIAIVAEIDNRGAESPIIREKYRGAVASSIVAS